MKLIVGLGNPGIEYENTRHNIGFYFVDLITKSLGNISFKEKFNGKYQKIKINGEDIIFLKPLSYMNLSGEVVSKFVNYYKIKIEDILIIHDDLDMQLAKIKLRAKGSSGGHNGIKNIILNLGNENFKRLKIGINKDKSIDIKDYVLGHFTKDELDKIKDINNLVLDIFNDYLKLSFNDLMSKYNGRDKHEEIV